MLLSKEIDVTTATPSCSIRVPRNRDPKSMSLVIPCYNEEEVLPELRRRLKDLVAQYTFPIEVVLIDDGSKDNTWPLICQYSHEDGFVKAIRLARNFGHQIAVTAGLDYAAGDAVVVMDADLQDPPEVIRQMLDEQIKSGKKFTQDDFIRMQKNVVCLQNARDLGPIGFGRDNQSNEK